MFVRVIRGKLGDQAALLGALDGWDAEVRPGAHGFLGSTAGTTRDGQFVLVRRFADQETAGRDSEREEHRAWWAVARKAFAGPVVVFDSNDVDVSMGGGADDAGFVQILIGQGERRRALDVLTRGEDVLRRERPDIIGGFTAWHDDGNFVDVAYFRSEAEAREGETKSLSAEGRALFEQLAAAMPVREYLDVPQPRFR